MLFQILGPLGDKVLGTEFQRLPTSSFSRNPHERIALVLHRVAHGSATAALDQRLQGVDGFGGSRVDSSHARSVQLQIGRHGDVMVVLMLMDGELEEEEKVVC